MNGEKVSDSFLKHAVYEENSDYKKSIIITSANDAKHSNSQGIHKLEIYRDQFGNGHKMVFSQKVFVLTNNKLWNFIEISMQTLLFETIEHDIAIRCFLWYNNT